MTTLDLERLVDIHPKLPPVRAAELAECAALALEARKHEPGVELAIEFLDDRGRRARLAWTRRGPANAMMRNAIRITEDGADGITLAVIGMRKWRVLRCLQKGTYADWLIVDEAGTERALEVAGTAEGNLAAAMRHERDQVDKSPYSRRSVCVVRFAEPRLVLEHRP